MIYDQGRWGVLIGASSGFGELVAQRLAGRGMSLVLTGRNRAGSKRSRSAPGRDSRGHCTPLGWLHDNIAAC